MKATHLNAIAAIEEVSFSTPWSDETLAGELADSNVVGFVAITDMPPAVIGYTFMRRSFEEGHIENIAVLPLYRGLGVASALMDALFEWATAHGLESIILEVRQGNRAAMALYHKFGFKIESYRRNYYTNPTEDAILMRKILHERQ